MQRPNKFSLMDRDEQISFMFDLVHAFSTVKTPYQTALLLQDLLTANEIRNISIRLQIAKLLLSGKSQRDTAEQAHTSIATVTKVNAWLDAGGDGLKNVIKKLPLKWKVPSNYPKGPIEFHLPQTLLKLVEYSLAKSQDKPVGKFIKNVEKKKYIDKEIKKYFDEYYRENNM